MIPQFKSDKTGQELAFYNSRQRGFLTQVDDRLVVFFAEEDVMGKYEVLIMFGGPNECYAIKNKAEYFAEGVQA